MVELKIEWTKENVDNFVDYSAFRKSPLQKVALIVLCAVYVAVTTICVVLYAMSGEIFALIGGISIFALGVCFAVVLSVMLSGYKKRLLKLNSESGVTAAMIDSDKIVVIVKDIPLGKILWENVEAVIQDNKKQAVYIITKENAILILEYKNITFGSEEELKRIFGEVDGKLSKKA